MDKESTYQLQRIDCNCNDCSFLFRWLEKQNIILADDKAEQQDSFNLVKERKIQRTKKDILNLEENFDLIKSADIKIKARQTYLKTIENSKHGYQGQKSPIQYGVCCKFQKQISFLPNTCQLETQKCFIHRKDYVAT